MISNFSIFGSGWFTNISNPSLALSLIMLFLGLFSHATSVFQIRKKGQFCKYGTLISIWKYIIVQIFFSKINYENRKVVSCTNKGFLFSEKEWCISLAWCMKPIGKISNEVKFRRSFFPTMFDILEW